MEGWQRELLRCCAVLAYGIRRVRQCDLPAGPRKTTVMESLIGGLQLLEELVVEQPEPAFVHFLISA